MQTNTPQAQDRVLRRDLDVLLEPGADAVERAAKFAKFAVRRPRRCACALLLTVAPRKRTPHAPAPPRRRPAGPRRSPLTMASAAWRRWQSHKTR
jgi:hypothetical protein